MISSRKLEDLVPAVEALAKAHIAACAAEGIELLVYCTYRDFEAQDALYAQGRKTAGAIVTNVRGGDSYHNYRCAYDCVPLVQGKPAWNDQKLYARVGALGESLGLSWSGRWSGKLKETAHFQYTGGLSLQDLKAGKQIPASSSTVAQDSIANS